MHGRQADHSLDKEVLRSLWPGLSGERPNEHSLERYPVSLFLFVFLFLIPISIIFCLSSSSLWASLVAQMVKNLPVMQETWVWSLGQEDSPGEGNGNPLQYSCLENSLDRGAWGSQSVGHSWATNTFFHSSIFPFPSNFLKNIFIFLTALGFSWFTWDLRSSL